MPVVRAFLTCAFGLAGFLTGGLEVALMAILTVPCLRGVVWCMAAPEGTDGFLDQAVGARAARPASVAPR